MATRNPTHRLARTDQPSDIGPAVTFAATVLVTFAALAAAAATLPRDAIMPAVSLLFFMFAGITALAAWRLGQTPRHRALSYWDVGGPLVRQILTRLARYMASPLAFLTLFGYGALWFLYTFEWHLWRHFASYRSRCSSGS
jgi:hypothetical protein